MKQIALKNNKGVALVDDADYEYLRHVTWYLHPGGYACGVVVDGKARRRVYMHRLIMQPTGKLCVDHRNRNRLDNRRKNLRICTIRQNCSHQVAHDRVGKASPFKGVRLDKRDGRWNVMIRGEKKRYYLGTFATDREAAAAYNGAAMVLHGEFALINSL